MIHILGAGSMGCLWAAHLSHSTSVNFITRQSAQYACKQFSLFSPHSTRCSDYKIPAISPQEILAQPSLNPIETLLVCTKSYDTLPALLQLKAKLSVDTKIVLFQNGLGSQYDVINTFPNNPILAAVSTEGANKQLKNKLIHAGIGATQLGLLTKHDQHHLQHCYQQLATSELVVHQHPDIWQALWKKLIINCAINPFTALLDCSNGQIEQHPFFKQHWPPLKQELSHLLHCANYPMNATEIEQLVFDVMHKTQNNISSMLQDVRNQNHTEIDHINGFAYHFLKQHAQPCHTNKLLWESVNALRN